MKRERCRHTVVACMLFHSYNIEQLWWNETNETNERMNEWIWILSEFGGTFKTAIIYNCVRVYVVWAMRITVVIIIIIILYRKNYGTNCQ